MNLLITGGAGFIGSNLVHLAIERGHYVVTLDALTYAGSKEYLSDLETSKAHRFVHGDIRSKETVEAVLQAGFKGSPFDAVINCAAETHVDRSLIQAIPFADSNVLGTAVLLELSRAAGIPVFIQISTDEVYGSIEGSGSFTTASPLHPSSPYSSSKAGADLFALSFYNSWGYDVRITRCTNNYGPYQHPEKFIPTVITSILNNHSIPIYGDGKNVRDWIFVRDHCEGILAVLERGKAGAIYHFSASNERSNIDLAESLVTIVARKIGRDEADVRALLTYVTDRPGHDRRYSLDSSETRTELNWQPATSWEDGIEATVDWYCTLMPSVW